MDIRDTFFSFPKNYILNLNFLTKYATYILNILVEISLHVSHIGDGSLTFLILTYMCFNLQKWTKDKVHIFLFLGMFPGCNITWEKIGIHLLISPSLVNSFTQNLDIPTEYAKFSGEILPPKLLKYLICQQSKSQKLLIVCWGFNLWNTLFMLKSIAIYHEKGKAKIFELEKISIFHMLLFFNMIMLHD